MPPAPRTRQAGAATEARVTEAAVLHKASYWTGKVIGDRDPLRRTQSTGRLAGAERLRLNGHRGGHQYAQSVPSGAAAAEGSGRAAGGRGILLCYELQWRRHGTLYSRQPPS
eukprot:scaffold2032_cov392-Prasinococcus_capsulatus_cf.AAC.1